MELFLMTGMINISLKLCLKKQLLGYGIDIKSVPFHSFPIKKVAFFHQKKSLHHWNKSGDGELFCFRLLLNSHN